MITQGSRRLAALNAPALMRSAAGLHIEETLVHWYEVKHLGRRIVAGRHDAERIMEGNIQGALQRLVERVQPSHPYVHTHLDPLHLRHLVLTGPLFDELALFDVWLEEETRRHLPPGTDLDGFVRSVHVLDQHDDQIRCLVVLARPEAVAQRDALVREAGLVPLRIGTLALDVAFVVEAQRPAHSAAPQGLVVQHGQDASLVRMERGQLRYAELLPVDGEAPEVIIDVVHSALEQRRELDGQAPPDTLLLAGSNLKPVLRSASHRSTGPSVAELRLELGRAGQPGTVPSAEVGAAALAWAPRAEAGPVINLLPLAIVEERAQGFEKQMALGRMLVLGGVFAAALVVLTLAAGYITHRQAETEAALLLQADQVARVERVRSDIKRIAGQVRQAQRLVTERTQSAVVLSWLGAQPGHPLWLTALDLTAHTKPMRLTLTGLTTSDRFLAEYLDQLEQGAYSRRVRLVYAERSDTQRLYRGVEVSEPYLTQFEIQLELDPDPQAEQAHSLHGAD